MSYRPTVKWLQRVNPIRGTWPRRSVTFTPPYRWGTEHVECTSTPTQSTVYNYTNTIYTLQVDHISLHLCTMSQSTKSPPTVQCRNMAVLRAALTEQSPDLETQTSIHFHLAHSVCATICKRSKGFYIAQYPVHRTAQSAFTHCFPGRPVQSNTISISLGSIQPHATIKCAKGCAYTYPPLSGTHLYSWVNWSTVEWKNLPTVLTPQHRIRTLVLLVESQEVYPWATALYINDLNLSHPYINDLLLNSDINLQRTCDRQHCTRDISTPGWHKCLYLSLCVYFIDPLLYCKVWVNDREHISISSLIGFPSLINIIVAFLLSTWWHFSEQCFAGQWKALL